MAEDFYALLAVRRDASAGDVADALRLELMKWSRRASNAPRAADRAEADQRVELLGEVKAVLGDPVRRAQYDREMGFTQPQPQPQPQPVPVPAPVMPAPVLPTPVWPQQPAQPPVGPQQRMHGTAVLQRLRRPRWNALLILFGVAAILSSGSASDPAGELALGIVCLGVAVWRSGVGRGS
jgi:hypothetical protein